MNKEDLTHNNLCVLYEAKVYIRNGQIYFEYGSHDPQLIKEVFKESDGIKGVWRVVDRLRACSVALDKDWDSLLV